MKKRTVEYVREARSDPEWIYDTIATASTPNVAAGYDRRIRNFCARLEYASERGQRRDDIQPGLRIVGFERRATIAFSVGEERVTILRIFYGGADWRRRL